MQNISSDNTPNAPKITFPCRYPVKVMGEANASFHADVRAVFERHAPGVQDTHVSVRPSTKGNYVAITVVIEATGKEQLEILFTDLKTLAAVKLVL